MDMEPQVAVECEGLFQSESFLVKDGEPGIISSLPCIVASQQPVKKQTRQWAAWTGQEEESFFNALRQVGKNFEKITCRVQSKNKDQVRHYYYRLVRRMNKLLGPGFSLDAKNSKDTNAAMLRWWSLLEKYSCKASKLHLKPRRFKIFIEALEHQLLKDRKKNTRKRPSQGEGSPTASPVAVSLNNRASGHDTRPVKLVIVDSQMIQKVGPGKGSSLKRNTGTNRNKSDLSTVKTLKQRRKTGGASSAAYKRWEKAAIAGVSLVADAAEHLERATTNKRFSPDQGVLDEAFPRTVVPTGQNISDSLGVLPPLPLSAASQPQVVEASEQQAFTKLKLQLFPIDESTRTALEKDEHNPYLELTLSARKKISSVLEHLNRKWGNSSIASGTLMLFPYIAEKENLVGYPRWMQDTVASAADVYAIVGSPTTFRLRYGWFSRAELMSVTFRRPSTPLYVQEEHTTRNIFNGKEQILDPTLLPTLHDCNNCDQLTESAKDQPTSRTENTDLIPRYTDLPEDITGYIGMDHEKSLPKPEHAINSSWLRKEIGHEIIRRRCEDADNLRTSNDATLSAGDWADSLTNISIGELLSEASQAMGTNNIEPSAVASSQFLQQIPFSCDSFDAAIAAHISGCQDKQNLLSSQVSHAPSILDAEETCDAFSFRKISSPPVDTSFETRKQVAHTCSMVVRGSVKELPEVHPTDDRICSGGLTDHCGSDIERLDDSNAQRPDEFTQDLAGLTDIYWPDSLGPLDLDMPSSRYHDQDLMFGDNSISLSGLNRLIASSLDAFQNCSFFGLEKKEAPLTTSEARGTATLLDYKIGGEV